ncbi:MAG: hypothetical protein QXX95_00095 [Nitrososphaerales archaeon]
MEFLKLRGIKANIDFNPRNRIKPKVVKSYRFDGRSYRIIEEPLKGSSHG